MVDCRVVLIAASEALAVAQVIDGIEHIGLAHAIVANEAVHLGRKLQLRLGNVLIVQYCKLLQCHSTAKVVKSFHLFIIQLLTISKQLSLYIMSEYIRFEITDDC